MQNLYGDYMELKICLDLELYIVLANFRFIWSATINESITFSIHDNDGKEVYTITSNKTSGDSEIINDSKMDNIRDHQFFVSIEGTS